jgi:hypothetical protein
LTAQEFRSVFDALPFRPFKVCLADGREVPVPHQDYALLSPTGRTLIVYRDDGSFHVIDLMLATRLAVNGKSPKSAIKRKN